MPTLTTNVDRNAEILYGVIISKSYKKSFLSVLTAMKSQHTTASTNSFNRIARLLQNYTTIIPTSLTA